VCVCVCVCVCERNYGYPLSLSWLKRFSRVVLTSWSTWSLPASDSKVEATSSVSVRGSSAEYLIRGKASAA
jgi:hypothetical protein